MCASKIHLRGKNRRAKAVKAVSPLSSVLHELSTSEAIEVMRATAQWLAELHLTASTTLPVEPACERIGIFDLADALARAAANNPDQLSLLLDLLQTLRGLAPAEDMPKLVPIHGNFTPHSVVWRDKSAIVTNVGRQIISQPAKDVALFIHTVKALYSCSGISEAGVKAEKVSREFRDEYHRRFGQLSPTLDYYKAFYALKDYAFATLEQKPTAHFHLCEFNRSVRDVEIQCGTAEGIQFASNIKFNTIELNQSTGRVTEPGFIRQFVGPVATGKLAKPAKGFNCRTAIVQNTGTGRMTLRYDFDDAVVVYGKLFSDGLGQHSYRVMQTLWNNGFNYDSQNQIPEPLAFLPEYNLALMRGVEGVPLGTALQETDAANLVAGTRKAARWLAAFHRASVRIGAPEPDWDSLKIFRICARLTKAAAAQPAQCEILLDYLHTLEAHIRKLPERRPVVQTHGRYHHDHIFISNGATAVIDLDRSRPADPAKDVAEFVRVLRMASFKSGLDMSRADEATKAFLEEYLLLMPDAHIGLSYYWSSFVALSLFGLMKKADIQDPHAWKLLSFHVSELERAINLKL